MPAFFEQPASQLLIRLDRLRANVHALQRLIGPDVGINAVIKKNAYGLGGPPLGRALVDAGCRMLTVWSPPEAQALADAGIAAPALVLMPVWRMDRQSKLYNQARRGLLHLTIHSLDQLPSLNKCATDLGLTLNVQLMLDTGMSRGALSPEAFARAAETLPGFTGLRLAGVFSHFATADTGPGFVGVQAARFDDALVSVLDQLPPDAQHHLANSYGLLLKRELHHQMVRPGLLLLGYARPGVSQNRLLDGALTESGDPVFQPIVRWTSHLIHTHPQPAGATVGYGATCTLHRDTMIGLVPVGYADGYPVALSNRAVVRIFDSDKLLGEAAVLGRVNMDQITIDLTDLNNAGHTDWPRYTVELFADEWQAKNSVPNLAALAETHAYEIICRVANHVPRIYM